MSKQQPTTPERASKTNVFSPAVDIEESQEAIVVWADMPGVSESDVRVTLEKKTLTIAAMVEPDDYPSYRLPHRGCHQGGFQRVFTISDAIDEDRISAALKDGVLRVVLPKSEPAKPRRIVVKPA